MADHDQGAGPGVEVVLHHGEGVDVEVVGRLIEQQDVRLADQQPQQLQAAALATGQVADPGGQPLAGEAEVLQQAGRGHLLARGDLGDAAFAADQVQHPLAGGQLSHGLGQVADVDGPTALDPAGVRRQVTGEQPQQGGLAGAVDADQTDPIARSDRPGQIGDQGAVGDAYGHVGQVEHVLAEPGHREPVELQPVPRRRFVLDQHVGRVDPELRLGRPGRGASPEPASSLRSRFLRRVAMLGRLARALGPGQHVRRVPAVVGVDDAVVDLPTREQTASRNHRS